MDGDGRSGSVFSPRLSEVVTERPSWRRPAMPRPVPAGQSGQSILRWDFRKFRVQFYR